jgi:SM-20-related protein
MPRADFFGRHGLFVTTDFFDRETCARIRAAVQNAPAMPGDVGLQNGQYAIDETIRKVLCADVPAPMMAFVEDRLHALKPALESHFQTPLDDHAAPQFLIYKEGAFYRPHRDSRTDSSGALFSKARQVSVSIFLNGESDTPEPISYCGGSLTFYGLFNSSSSAKIGFPLVGESGLLVAFRANLLHGVAPITHGVRYSIVTWFRGLG